MRPVAAISADGSGWAAVFVKLIDPVVLAQVGDPDLEDGLAAAFDPELLRALDPLVELLNQRLHRRTGDGQARLAIVRVIHPVGIALHILQGQRHDASRIVIRCLGRGWPQALAGGLKAGDQRLDLAGPSPTKPLLV